MFSKNFLAILLLYVLPAFSIPPPEIKEPMKPGPYIVTLGDGVDPEAYSDTFPRRADGTSSITHRWKIINGFAGNFSEHELKYLVTHPNVSSIEKDGHIYPQKTITQKKVPWSLARISSRKLTRKKKDPSLLNYEYTYESTAGKGVNIFIIDSGVFGHRDFHGRIVQGISLDPESGLLDHKDRSGHGTFVAGAALSTTYGIAKRAWGLTVKVLDDNTRGHNSAIINGLDWVLEYFTRNKDHPTVVCLSYVSDDVSLALDAAVTRLFKSEVPVAVCAGNNNKDAMDVSPARSPAAFTVGSSNISDARSDFSNFGKAVDIFAPGEDVTSLTVDGKIGMLSGTSFANGYVAGFFAVLLSLDSTLTALHLYIVMQLMALRGILSNIDRNTVNLLFNTEWTLVEGAYSDV